MHMNSSVFNQKELLTGILYVAFGAVAVIMGQDYGFGSLTEMDAGFFPIVLGYILIGIGLLTLGRAFIRGGDGEPGPLRTIYWKGFALVIGSTALFALVLPFVGLIVALPLMILMSAMGSSRFSLSLKSLALLVCFIAACIGLFVEGLGVPMPLFGTVFG
ncbi:hypothetical protein L905_07170 [Agrobacterium sp. TS43]|nr:hypothetical protein L905_07170 [Agrobacterium sp. TS43]